MNTNQILTDVEQQEYTDRLVAEVLDSVRTDSLRVAKRWANVAFWGFVGVATLFMCNMFVLLYAGGHVFFSYTHVTDTVVVYLWWATLIAALVIVVAAERYQHYSNPHEINLVWGIVLSVIFLVTMGLGLMFAGSVAASLRCGSVQKYKHSGLYAKGGAEWVVPQ